jgi:Tfp pilus assembly protein PilF
MELINISINKILLLDQHQFTDSNNNIDALIAQAARVTDNLDRLDFLNKAIIIIDKFHSFWHFEQSYFHLQLALKHLANKNMVSAKQQLELAIFQDHCNWQAIDLLNNQSSRHIYSRPYKSFVEYLSFATNESPVYINNQGYWQIAANNLNNTEELLKHITDHHKNYHQESAKIYLNRAMIFNKLNQSSLAKNDLVKACNLDDMLAKRAYYKHI